MEPKFKDEFLSLPPLKQAGIFLWPSLEGSTLTQEEENCLAEIQPSGMVFFKRNFTSFAQGQTLIAQVKERSKRNSTAFTMPFIASVDEEGGRVSRLPPPFPKTQSALSFADSRNEDGLVNQVLHQCFVAKALGLNCLLAPVADVLTEPQNQVLGDRCFGRDPHTAAQYAQLVHRTIAAQGLFSCAKHFPGHGNTTTDTHTNLATSSVTLQELKTREWVPFQTLIQNQVPFVMAAHVSLTQVDATRPATLSSLILQDHLRNQLGFNGLILSDDLRMNAMALHYKEYGTQYLQHASIDALKAGCDVLLSCHSIVQEQEIAHAIADKIQRDPLFKQELLEKAWRIFVTLTSLKT